MWVFDFLGTLIDENPMTGYILCTCITLYFAAAIVGFCLQNKNLYTAFAVMITCGASVMFSAAEKSLEFLWVSVAGFVFIAAGFYALMVGGLMWRAHIIRRRKRRAEILRKVQYTLPEKNNSYIRDRLNTALKTENTPIAEMENTSKETGEKGDFQTAYAKKLLQKIQEAPLTKAERLEMEEVSRIFSAYLKKSRWTVEDVHLINDMFSYLLKISAKYAL